MARSFKSAKNSKLPRLPKRSAGSRKNSKYARNTAAEAFAPTTRSGRRSLKGLSYKDRRKIKKSEINLARQKKVPGSFRIFRDSIEMLHRNWQTFLGITVIYGLLNAFLVHGFSITNSITSAKKANDALYHGFFGQFTNGLSLFNNLFQTSGIGNNGSSNTYQAILVILVSLALIWALRQVYQGVYVRVKDAFYQGMYPLMIVLLVLFVMLFQLVPLFLGSALFTNVFASAVTVNLFQKILWALICFLIALPTFYYLTASIFAIYIGTLPNMTPLKALRSATELVRYRRLIIVRKLLFIPIALFFLLVVIMFPVVLLLTPLAPWIFLILTMFVVTFFHSYMYSLYRSLL